MLQDQLRRVANEHFVKIKEGNEKYCPTLHIICKVFVVLFIH